MLAGGANLYRPNSFHLGSLAFELRNVANEQHGKRVRLLSSLPALSLRTSLPRTASRGPPTRMGERCGKRGGKPRLRTKRAKKLGEE